jgi:hypothetical protein
MTVAEVKRDLPPVKIRYAGHVWTARVTGRLNQFASVSPHARSRGKLVDVILGPIFHFSWEAVARAASDANVILNAE